MIPDQDYALSLLFAAEPTDRALAGWGDGERRIAGLWLRADADWQAASESYDVRVADAAQMQERTKGNEAA